jgi:hypothetical protein
MDRIEVAADDRRVLTRGDVVVDGRDERGRLRGAWLAAPTTHKRRQPSEASRCVEIRRIRRRPLLVRMRSEASAATRRCAAKGSSTAAYSSSGSVETIELPRSSGSLPACAAAPLRIDGT